MLAMSARYSSSVLTRTLPSGLSVQSRIGCLETTAFTTQTLLVGRHISSWRGMNYAPRLRLRGIQRGMDPNGMQHGSTLIVGKDTNTITSSFANVIVRECERQLDGVVQWELVAIICQCTSISRSLQVSTNTIGLMKEK